MLTSRFLFAPGTFLVVQITRNFRALFNFQFFLLRILTLFELCGCLRYSTFIYVSLRYKYVSLSYLYMKFSLNLSLLIIHSKLPAGKFCNISQKIMKCLPPNRSYMTFHCFDHSLSCIYVFFVCICISMNCMTLSTADSFF